MRPLKLFLAALIGLVAIAAVVSGFVVVAAIGAVVLLILWIRRLITGKPAVSVKFQRTQPGSSAPRPFGAEDAIEVESTTVKEPPRSLDAGNR